MWLLATVLRPYSDARENFACTKRLQFTECLKNVITRNLSFSCQIRTKYEIRTILQYDVAFIHPYYTNKYNTLRPQIIKPLHLLISSKVYANQTRFRGYTTAQTNHPNGCDSSYEWKHMHVISVKSLNYEPGRLTLVLDKISVQQLILRYFHIKCVHIYFVQDCTYISSITDIM